jgi:hypothetical protein
MIKLASGRLEPVLNEKVTTMGSEDRTLRRNTQVAEQIMTGAPHRRSHIAILVTVRLDDGSVQLEHTFFKSRFKVLFNARNFIKTCCASIQTGFSRVQHFPRKSIIDNATMRQ